MRILSHLLHKVAECRRSWFALQSTRRAMNLPYGLTYTSTTLKERSGATPATLCKYVLISSTWQTRRALPQFLSLDGAYRALGDLSNVSLKTSRFVPINADIDWSNSGMTPNRHSAKYPFPIGHFATDMPFAGRHSSGENQDPARFCSVAIDTARIIKQGPNRKLGLP